MARNSTDHFPSPGSFATFIMIKCEKHPASAIKFLDDFGRKAEIECLTFNLPQVKHLYEIL